MDKTNFEINEESVSLESYDKMAEYYFTYVDEKPYNAYYERPAMLSMLPDVKNKTLLDAGCAAGWYTQWMLKSGASVTSIDFSSNMIEMTKKRVGDKARVVRADLSCPLDFLEDNYFDIILSSLTLHYIKNWDDVFKEFNRILKVNGVFVFSVHHPFMDFSYFKRENYFLTELLEDEWNLNGEKVNVQFYRRPLTEIINSINNAGFSIENIEEPIPDEILKQKFPGVYDNLSKKPQFLFFKVRKMK